MSKDKISETCSTDLANALVVLRGHSMSDDRMREMRLKRMAERQGLLLEKARSLAARQAAQYHLIRGTEAPVLRSGNLDEIERQLTNDPATRDA
jgi:hypothetical protein